MVTLIRGGTATQPVSTGTIAYQEIATAVPDPNGVFSHVIGTGTAVGAQALTASDFDTGGNPLFVEIQVEGEVMLPRTQVLSVPYAIEAERVGGMTAQAIIGQAGGNAFANAVVRSGAGLDWGSVSQVSIRAGTLGFSDGVVRRNTVSLIWDFANGVGPLGLDQGAEASNTWYYLYAIPDPLDDTRFSAVASVNAPTHAHGSGPTGFSVHRFLGTFHNDAVDIRHFRQIDDGEYQYEGWAAYRQNNAVTPTVLTPIDLSAQLPETVMRARFHVLKVLGGDETVVLYNEAQTMGVWVGRTTGNATHAMSFDYPINPDDRRVHLRGTGIAQANGWVYIDVVGYSEHLD